MESRKEKISFLNNLKSGKGSITELIEPETFIPASYFPERLLKNKDVNRSSMLAVSSQQEFTPLEFAEMLQATAPNRINMVFLNPETAEQINTLKKSKCAM